VRRTALSALILNIIFDNDIMRYFMYFAITHPTRPNSDSTKVVPKVSESCEDGVLCCPLFVQCLYCACTLSYYPLGMLCIAVHLRLQDAILRCAPAQMALYGQDTDVDDAPMAFAVLALLRSLRRPCAALGGPGRPPGPPAFTAAISGGSKSVRQSCAATGPTGQALGPADGHISNRCRRRTPVGQQR
jgi:hypothetical protein